MRRIFFTIAILLFSWNVFSQGIQFEIGSWKEVLQKAKQENKLIFVDLYTTWCGPCKKMAAETFPQQAVGDYFNKNFVNYKIDAEKARRYASLKSVLVVKRYSHTSKSSQSMIGETVLCTAIFGLSDSRSYLFLEFDSLLRIP